MSKKMSYRPIRWKNATEEERLQRMKELLYRRIIKTRTGCWEFTGSINKHGYGEIHIGGKINPTHHNAHRVSWIVHKGEVPIGLIVCHVCDNRSCCNPEHLFLGTHKDNMQDMIKKGRSRFLKGEECPWAKLTEKQILEILKMFENGATTVEVAKKFNIDRRNASDIKRGRRWGHIGDRSKIEKIEPNRRILNEEIVKEIKQKFRDGARICDVAKEYRCARSTIDDIHKGISWKHVK